MTNANRWSWAAVHKAALPILECPMMATRLASMSLSVSRKSIACEASQAMTEITPHT